MGEKYIKEENGKKVLYEKSFICDTKLGELYEKFDGSFETRNFCGEDYKLSEKRSIFGVVTDIIPGTKPHDYEVETSNGKKGTFEYNDWTKRYECDKLREKESIEHPRSYSYESSGSYSSEGETSSTTGDSIAGIVVFWLLVAIGLAWLFWYHEEKSASNYYQTPTSYYDESYSRSPHTSRENIVTKGEDKKVENTTVREIPSEEISFYQQLKKTETEANNSTTDMDSNRKNNTESIVKAFEEGKVEMK